MRRRLALAPLWRNSDAAAAAEMALVLPILLVLAFGSFETGRYFLDEHVVVKAVRDGVRYASRQSFTDYDCTSSAVSAGATTKIVNVVRFGKTVVADTDAPRLSYWGATSDGKPTVSVTLTCPTALKVGEPHGGLYSTRTNVPVVSVSARVEYAPLFGLFGFGGGLLDVVAESQSAVMGI